MKINFQISILLAILAFLLTSCGKKIPDCSDSNVISLLTSSIIEKENLKNNDKLKFIAEIITEDKTTKNENEKNCQGQLSLSLNDEIIKEFKELNNELESKTGIAFQNVNIKPTKIDVQYKIKINEKDKNYFVESKWKSFADEIDFTPLNQIKNKDKILNNISNIKDIVDAEKWLNAEPQSSIIAQQTLSQKFNLDKDDSSFSVWCHFSNDAGEIVTYRSIPANIFAISLGVLAGGSIPGKYNIVKNKDALEKIFNTDKTVEHHETKFSIF